ARPPAAMTAPRVGPATARTPRGPSAGPRAEACPSRRSSRPAWDPPGPRASMAWTRFPERALGPWPARRRVQTTTVGRATAVELVTRACGWSPCPALRIPRGTALRAAPRTAAEARATRVTVPAVRRTLAVSAADRRAGALTGP